MARSDSQRQAELKSRKRLEGLVRLEVWVPAGTQTLVKSMIEEMIYKKFG